MTIYKISNAINCGWFGLNVSWELLVQFVEVEVLDLEEGDVTVDDSLNKKLLKVVKSAFKYNG